MAIATLTVDIVAKLGTIQADLDKLNHLAEQSSQRMANSFAAAASAFKVFAGALGVGLSIGGLEQLVSGSISAMASLRDLSMATGASVESLSAMKMAAKLSGTTIEDVGGSIKKLAIALGDARLKGGDKATLFAQLGIDPTTVKDTGAALFELSKKLVAMPDQVKAIAIARELLGKQASLPFLNELAAQEALITKVTTAQANAAKEFEDNLIRLKGGTGALGMALANLVLPPMNEILTFSLEIKKEWGLLAAIIAGIGGGTLLKALGVDLDPAARAADEAAKAFNRLVESRKKLVEAQGATDVGGIVTNNALGNWLKDQKIASARKDVEEASTAYREALKRSAKLNGDAALAFQRSQRKSVFDVADAEDKVKKAKTGKTDLDRMLELGQKNLMHGLDSEEEMRIAATVREMKDAAEEFAGLQRMLKVGEQNELAAYYETAGEEVMRLVAEQQALKGSLDEFTEFAKEAARNMQDAMANFFFDAMDGKFENMASNFGKAIQRMVANAVAADLSNKLLGDFGKTGKIGGWAADLLGFFGGGGGGYSSANIGSYGNFDVPQFASGTPYVPRTGLALIHQGERIIPADQNRGGFGGTIIVNVNGGAAPDVRRAAGQGAREALSAFSGANRYV